ncbi:hypothetical protein Anapl_07413 [Anas platyrhynchos]|uniref:Uncharacterized protein n=1 Tax=Anas platyrhynchos TaxID=8839 RepID=R0LT25_ANAPL|nr:hypothetical protein Anapl_07413 [Anas platyrhynchos]
MQGCLLLPTALAWTPLGLIQPCLGFIPREEHDAWGWSCPNAPATLLLAGSFPPVLKTTIYFRFMAYSYLGKIERLDLLLRKESSCPILSARAQVQVKSDADSVKGMSYELKLRFRESDADRDIDMTSASEDPVQTLTRP